MLKHITKDSLSILIFFTILIRGMLYPTAVISSDKSNLICDNSSQYLVRLLARDEEHNICEVYKGQLMLVVNTASRCAFTDQYDDLEKLYSEYKDRGLVVIGFPSNDFGNQEPGNEQKIKNFCRLTYGVEFPMYAKSRVKGSNADPLYRKLYEISGQAPQWNFHKYLIDRNGTLVGSYKSSISPYNRKIIQDIEKHL